MLKKEYHDEKFVSTSSFWKKKNDYLTEKIVPKKQTNLKISTRNKANENSCGKEMLIYSSSSNIHSISLIVNFWKSESERKTRWKVILFRQTTNSSCSERLYVVYCGFSETSLVLFALHIMYQEFYDILTFLF